MSASHKKRILRKEKTGKTTKVNQNAHHGARSKKKDGEGRGGRRQENQRVTCRARKKETVHDQPEESEKTLMWAKGLSPRYQTKRIAKRTPERIQNAWSS